MPPALPLLPSSAPLVPAFSTGLLLSATLIVAIGAQNAFVLRQGLRREHVGLVVAFCAAADAVLLAVGVLGVGSLLAAAPAIAAAMAAAGALFLAVYGVIALRRALRPGRLDATGGGQALTRRSALAQVAAFTLLNPHVYLDTVLLFGTVAAQQASEVRPAFLVGGMTASAVWFALLGYGARALAPWFARPTAWRLLDLGIGLTMLAIAAGLVKRLVGV